jgi:glycosyltransferase involved in cell wall biosynthesis
MDISIVMPCLNEVITLPSCIKKAQEAIAMTGLAGEVVIADNGSTDGSQALATSLGARVVHIRQRGYGAALVNGLEAAYGRYLVMGDADDSYDFREAVPMVKRLQAGAGLVMGTRLRGKIEAGAMPWKNRYLGTPVLTWILNRLFRGRFSDVNCGLRAFTKETFQKLQMESSGMEFASEMLIKAAILGVKTDEVPITLAKDGRNRPPHLRPWADGWRHLKYILLFAPKALFLLPGFFLLALGALFMVALNITSDHEFVYLGGFRFNDHWIIVASILSIVGYQILLTGGLSYLYTLAHRIQNPSRRTDALTRLVTFEHALIFALILIACGLGLEINVVRSWIAANYGPLAEIRHAATGATLILLGTQTLSSSFFYAVVVDAYRKRAASRWSPGH